MEITYYLLSLVICSTIASPLDKQNAQVESEDEEVNQGINLMVENVNFDDLSSRILGQQELDRVNDEEDQENKQDNSIQMENIDFEKSQAQEPGLEQSEPVFQPFPGLNQEAHDLNSGYSQFENFQDNKEGETSNSEDRGLQDLDWTNLPNNGDNSDDSDDQTNDSQPLLDTLLDWTEGQPNGFLPESDEYINSISNSFPDFNEISDSDRKEVEDKPQPKPVKEIKKQKN